MKDFMGKDRLAFIVHMALVDHFNKVMIVNDSSTLTNNIFH